jgi:hypothetical protein
MTMITYNVSDNILKISMYSYNTTWIYTSIIYFCIRRLIQFKDEIVDTSGGFREGGRWGRSPPFVKNFSIFFQQKRTKNELILPRMDPKKYFLLTTAPPFEKKCPPPFQNPRSATA